MNFLICYDMDNAGVKETVSLRYSCARITEEIQLGIRAVRAASAGWKTVPPYDFRLNLFQLCFCSV